MTPLDQIMLSAALHIASRAPRSLEYHKRLRSQLRSLERRTRSGGKDSVDHGPRGHDDLANAAVGACVLAAQGEASGPKEILWL